MAKKSLVKVTVVLMIIQLSFVVLSLLFLIQVSYRTATDSMTQSMDNIIQIYGKELDNKLDSAQQLLERLVYKNTEYELLQSKNESERYYASMTLYQLLDESMAFDHYADVVLIAESQYGTCLDAENTPITFQQKQLLREFAKECAAKGNVKSQWEVKLIGELPYVCKLYSWQGKATIILISVDHFMDTVAENELEGMNLMLLDQNDQLWGYYGDEIPDWTLGEVYDTQKRNQTYWQSNPLEGGTLRIEGSIVKMNIKSQIKISMIVLFCIILVSLAIGTAIFIYIRKEILSPMQHMKDSMEKIQRGHYDLRIVEEYNNTEFSLLKDTFNHLIDEIVGLKIKSYERQIDLQMTELKCVKLQIRPHFFLNAMTTISSLSLQGRNKEIASYIDALSKNIRYMFKSGLHTVSLAEEINHVKNYFDMQEMKYPGCVFYSIEIEPELEEWRIPQMVIHTIVENEYKYAVSLDNMLMILIKASKVVKEGEEYLYLEIEDDGKGYPEEVLEEFQNQEMKTKEDGTRIGLWSIKKMLELMYEQTGLFQIGNVEPKGCMNHIWIPKRPIHEVEMFSAPK